MTIAHTFIGIDVSKAYLDIHDDRTERCAISGRLQIGQQC
jgi:hypothetical protein